MKKEFNGDSVIIMSCSKCNANCKHCYISFDGNLDGDELYDMVSKLKSKYKIYINGTEPLMNKEFLKSYCFSMAFSWETLYNKQEHYQFLGGIQYEIRFWR